MTVYIIGGKSQFLDYCHSYRLSPRECHRETFFFDEGQRVLAQVMMPGDTLVRLDGWQDRSGAAELWYDVHLFEARRRGR